MVNFYHHFIPLQQYHVGIVPSYCREAQTAIVNGGENSIIQLLKAGFIANATMLTYPKANAPLHSKLYQEVWG